MTLQEQAILHPWPSGPLLLQKVGGPDKGSANEWGLVHEVFMLPAKDQGQQINTESDCQKGAVIVWGTQLAPSTYPGLNAPDDAQQVTRDLTVLAVAAVLAVDFGRVWSLNLITNKLPGITGYVASLEWTLNNYGVDCTDFHDSIRSSGALIFGPVGSTPQTYIFRHLAGPGAHRIHALDAGAIAPGGAWVESDEDFVLRGPDGDVAHSKLAKLIAWAERTGKIS